MSIYMFIYIQIRVNGVPTAPYWFPLQSTLRATSDAWLYLAKSCSHLPLTLCPAIVIPAAIDCEKAISYARQNRTPT